MYPKSIAFSFFVFLPVCVILQSANAQTIAIYRIYQVDYIIGGCSLGYLAVDGEVICYSLELPWRSNQPNISCVPAGIYQAYVRSDGALGWRLEMYHVPSRTNIQIHIGNYTSDITGCTLVGMQADVDNCALYNSRDAMNLLRNRIEPMVNRWITVHYFN